MKTTDNQKEFFYLVNQNDTVLSTITRGRAHSSPNFIHRGVWILVFNDQGELFLQKRSLTKDRNPGLWSISVGGHVTYGQTYEEAAKREGEEELGESLACTKLAKFLVQSQFEREIDMLYKSQHNGPFRLHPQEIETGKFFNLQDLEKKIRNKKIIVSNWALSILANFCGIIPEFSEKKLITKIFKNV